jgi:DNA-binding transcriptional ArsR family regulator
LCGAQQGSLCWERSTRPRPNGRLRGKAATGSVFGVSLAVTPPREHRQASARGWTFITNHAQVLLAVAQKPDRRVREIAAATDITERYAYQVLRDLEDAGYVERRREGRSNLYRVHPELALGDPMVEGHALWELLRLIDTDDGADVVAMAASPRPRSKRRNRPRPAAA